MWNDSIPPPRRKSCEACKTAKRRCDLALPICSRCAQRNMPCIYPGRPPTGYSHLPLNLPPTIEMPENKGWHDFITSAAFTEINDLDLDAPSATSTPTNFSSKYGGDVSLDLWLNHDQELPLTTTYEIARPRAKQLTSLSEATASRLQYSVDVLKDAPKMMVMENQTPWCHRQLYKNYMPKVIQDIYAGCSLYISKNEVNAPVIMSLLDTQTTELLSSPQPTAYFDLLAHTHALLLHMIMRLFDGNMRSQVMADLVFTQLESSVLALLGYLQLPDSTQPAELLPLSMDTTIEFWASWILQESARRTVLITFYFVQVYKLLQGKIPTQCDGKLGLEHAWYLSAHLWNSQSAFDFAVAWAEKQHYIIDNLDFSWVLETAEPADFDVFGKMILITLLGIDQVRAWFYARGAVL